MRAGNLLVFTSLVIAVAALPMLADGATFNVTTYNDIADDTPDGVCDSCSLREAIIEANNLVGPDVINLPPGVYDMTIAGADEDNCLTGDLDIYDDVTIIGLGTTRIESQVGRVIHVISGNVSITGLTLTQGDANNDPSSGKAGGGVFNAPGSNLTLNNCTMRVNTAQGGGGGIYNGGTLTLNASTLTDNSAPGTSKGGGVYNNGVMTVTNSTLSGNSATDGAGAIYCAPGSSLTLNNTTIVNNAATGGGNGGGGINTEAGATVNISNTIVANNSASGANDDCYGTLTSGGDNIVRVTSGCLGLGADDITDVDPVLSPLQNNGGRTPTHIPLTGSPALDAGGTTACETLDQRGLDRPQNMVCDIGAVEVFPNCPTITLSPSTLPEGPLGLFYSETIAASGGVEPYSFAVTSGTLPPGLALNPVTGTISGVPTDLGQYNFTVTAFDDNFCPGSQSYSILIGWVCTMITLTPTSLPTGVQGQNYNQSLTADGGVGPYQYTVTDGTLPPGMTLNPSTGVLSGAPTESGTYPFVVTATDSHLCTGVQGYTLVITCALVFDPATLANGTEGIAYSQQLTVTGGSEPYTFAVISGDLPPGLTLTGAGLLSGTPTTPGTYVFVLEATDANFCTGNWPYTLVIDPCMFITPETLPDGITGVAYAVTFSTTGGTGPFTFSVDSGTLPPGLTLEASTGALTGTPTTAGIYLFTIGAVDSSSCTTSQDYVLIVNDASCPAIGIDPAGLPNGTLGTTYNENLSGTGGSSPYTFTLVMGALPPGLTLNTSSISGLPITAGLYTFTLGVTDNNNCSAIQEYSIIIVPATCPTITLSPATLPDGQPGVAYNQMISATGGVAPYLYTITAGALPAGMTLDAGTGILFGTPATAGTYNFTVTATDSTYCAGSLGYTLLIGGGGPGTCDLASDDFNDGVLSPDWTYVKPTWTESGGNLQGTPSGRKAIAAATPAFAGCLNCTFETRFSLTGGLYNRLWVLAWYLDKKNTVEVLVKEESNVVLLRQRSNGIIVAKVKVQVNIDTNAFYTANVSFDGTFLHLLMDGTEIATLKPSATLSTGTIGFAVKNTTGYFDYICVQ